MTKLSHSAANKYLECPRAYKYHYIERYRSHEQSAALLFGTAIDKALEFYCIERKKNVETSNLSYIKAREMFLNTWYKQDLNGKPTELFNCTEIVYGDNDLDLDLLSESDHNTVTETDSVEGFDDTIARILERKEKVGFKFLNEYEKTFLNRTNWLCMKHKGKLMVEEFVKWFDSNVTEVLATQKKIELEDESGNTIIGFVDLVVRLKGYDRPVFLDFKTSGRPYEQDSVVKSAQLGLYIGSARHEYEDTNLGGYYVLHKNIKKNKTKICKVCGNDGSGANHKTCAVEKEVGIIEKGKNKGMPKMERCGGEWNITIDLEVVTQYIVSEVPELFQERIVENYEEVTKGIQAEIFPRNFSSCVKYNGKVTCAFYDICHKNCTDNLIKKD